MDNIFCNNITLVEKCGIIIDVTSDHFPVFAQINIKLNSLVPKQELEYKFNYRKLPEFITHLTDELSEFESINDPEIAADTLISAYTTGIDKYSFCHKPTRKNSPIKPWITPAILVSIHERCKLFKNKQRIPIIETIIETY